MEHFLELSHHIVRKPKKASREAHMEEKQDPEPKVSAELLVRN